MLCTTCCVAILVLIRSEHDVIRGWQFNVTSLDQLWHFYLLYFRSTTTKLNFPSTFPLQIYLLASSSCSHLSQMAINHILEEFVRKPLRLRTNLTCGGDFEVIETDAVTGTQGGGWEPGGCFIMCWLHRFSFLSFLENFFSRPFQSCWLFFSTKFL